MCSTLLLLHVFVTEGEFCYNFREMTGFVIEAHGLIVIFMLDVGIYHTPFSVFGFLLAEIRVSLNYVEGAFRHFGAFGCVERETEREY